jgi:hypothetical protein
MPGPSRRESAISKESYSKRDAERGKPPDLGKLSLRTTDPRAAAPVLRAEAKRPAPIWACIWVFAVQFLWVTVAVLLKSHGLAFLGVIPCAAALYLGSAYLLWAIPRYWRWAVIFYFGVVIWASVRDYLDTPTHSVVVAILTWVLVPVMAGLIYALAFGFPVRTYLQHLEATEGTRKWELPLAGAMVCLVFVSFAAYLELLVHRLNPILDRPGIRLEPTELPAVQLQLTRRVNLGYAHFSVPGTLRGDLILLDPNGMVGLGPPPCLYLFTAPQNNSDIATLLQSASPLAGKPLHSLFELKKQEASQEPCTAWQIPVMGRRKTAFAATLLALKATEYGDAYAVKIFENGRIGAILTLRPKGDTLYIEDLKSGTHVNIVILPSAPDVDDLAGCVVNDYEFTGSATDTATILGEIEAVGIKAEDAPESKAPSN